MNQIIGRAFGPGVAGRPANLACAITPVACVVAFCLLLLASSFAYADSLTDRVTQVTKDEQTELVSHARMGGNTGGLCVIYAARDYPEATVLEYPGIADAVVALDAGKLDYAIVPEFTALLYMRQNSSYTYLSAGLYEFDNCFSFVKGNEELCEQFTSAIEKLKADGTIEAVERKWAIEGDYSMGDVPVREDGKVITVGCSATDEPLIFMQDGQLAGADVEIAMRVAYELGYRLEFHEMTFAAMLSSVTSGKVDMGLHSAPTDERKKTMCFTEPIYQLRWVAMTTTDVGAAVQAVGDGGGFIEGLRDSLTSTFITENRWQLVLQGLGVTVGISVGAFVLGTLGGALLCHMSRSKRRAASAFAAGYIKVATGIPALVWLMILYYVVFAGVDVPGIVVAVVCFGLVTAAPMCGIFKTALDSVDKGYVEASLALGFSRFQTFRNVVFPQAALAVSGLYAGQFTALVKGTSVVGYVAISDLTKVSDIIRARTFEAFFPLLATAVIYFVVIALAAWLFGRLARRIDPKRRSAQVILKGITPR